nr:zinc-binding dehydrogenase [Arthrobacter wenxiniae]
MGARGSAGTGGSADPAEKWFGRAVDREQLTELIVAGKVRPCLDRAFPLDQVQDAMRYFESGQVRGKVAITIPPPQ